MDKGYEKERFESLSIKASIAQKFRNYSKAINQSLSMTLLLMLEFFEDNNIAPTENLGPRMQTLEKTIKKRINALIAIVRDIEQQQTIPTKSMLEALFEGLPHRSKKKVLPSFEEALKNIDRESHLIINKGAQPDHNDIRRLLNQIKEVKPTLGKPYWKLYLHPNEIKRLKSKYHVYND